MRRQARSTNPLRMTLLAMAAVAAMLLALPGAGSYAAWNDSTPLGGTVTTGSLGIDQDTLGAGTWTKDGAAFDPAADKLTAGTTLTYTVTGIPVTAVGDNLDATFTVSGAQVPDAIKDHVTVDVTSNPTPVKGADSDADGHQTVDLALTVTAHAGLPSDAQTIDLSALAVTLSNGHRWSDIATLDAGTLSTGGGTAPGGKVDLQYNLEYDDDGVVGFYLQDPAPGTKIKWNLWNDGNEVITDAVDGLNSMDYSGSGSTPYIEIVGSFGGLGSPDQTVELIGALIDVQGWTDDIGSTSARYAFMNASHLKYVSSLPGTLRDASYAFKDAGTQAEKLYLGPWTPENTTTMAHMFDGATSFNQSVESWNTSNVTDMSAMFQGATAFNGNLNTNGTKWDVSRVTTMAHMFDGARTFNGDLSGWNTKHVKDMSSMFNGAVNFNGNIDRWNTVSVTTMANMFKDATAFNGNIAGWDTAKVASFSNMFNGATSFSAAIGGWDTSFADNMSNMFRSATTFNQDLSEWDTKRVNTMQAMFNDATAFSQDLSGWNVAKVANHKEFSDGSALAPEQLPKWNGTKAAPATAASAAPAQADDAEVADDQPADAASDTTADTSDTPGATTRPESADTTSDDDTDASENDAAPEEKPAPEEQVDPDQAVQALEEAWKHAQESDTDELRQALDDAAKVVDAVLGEGTADELVQQLEGQAAAAATTAQPTAG